MDSEPNSYPLVFRQDSPMVPVYRTLERVFASDATVLIEGENGTGKDALAHWLHHHSTRRAAPLIKIDLGSLPDELVESELFGYEPGAFTGALESKLGKLDLAQGGSVVLDEIANVDMRIQAKLLHVVEAKEFFRLGGTDPIHLDCRIIVLSSSPLARAVELKTFRQDLFFRLNLITVKTAPLRERSAEIFAIAEELLAQLGRKYNATVQLDSACEAILRRYEFPGNIRELRNGLERAMLMGSMGSATTPARITPDSLPADWLLRRQSSMGTMAAASASMPTLEDVERSYIAEVLQHTHGRIIKAAAILGISRKTLLEKRRKYNLP